MPALRLVTALAAGLLFGLGLAVSGLLNPAKIRAFVDVTGDWDPSMMFVLGSGVIVAMIGYRLAILFRRPLLDTQLHLPTKTKIDMPLVVGSAIFGVGWGVAGFCPGPAIASLSVGLAPAAIFVVAMLIGMVAHDRFLVGKG